MIQVMELKLNKVPAYMSFVLLLFIWISRTMLKQC